MTYEEVSKMTCEEMSKLEYEEICKFLKDYMHLSLIGGMRVRDKQVNMLIEEYDRRRESMPLTDEEMRKFLEDYRDDRLTPYIEVTDEWMENLKRCVKENNLVKVKDLDDLTVNIFGDWIKRTE